MKKDNQIVIAESKLQMAIPPSITPLLGKKKGYRWRICALLFFATTLNYMDRHVMSILAPTLQKEIGWTEIEYGYIVASFQVAYGLGVVLAGKLLDYKGTRILYAIAVSLWSLAGIAHAFAGSVASFAASRFTLGIGESANFPAAVKTVSEWFPGKERALVAGIFNAGSNIGVIVVALIVPWITLHYGWQFAFIGIGILGFIWVIFWLTSYTKPEEQSRLSNEELQYIQADNKKEDAYVVSWKELLFKKETIIVCIVRFISDPTWWFLLFWLPKFLYQKHAITLVDIGLPMIIIYAGADIGSVAGGWLSSQFIKRDKGLNYARKTTMLICAVSVIPILFASQTNNLYTSVALISLAAAAHNGWMANVYAIISDIFPRNAIGSVTGVATLSAVVGGITFAMAVGFILEKTGSYFLIFLISSFAYIIAWIILRIGIPDIKPVKFSR
jgi:ACS family hexuronate transporter-like MFS transporter